MLSFHPAGALNCVDKTGSVVGLGHRGRNQGIPGTVYLTPIHSLFVPGFFERKERPKPAADFP
jgi:hypothetical protein